MIDGGNSPYKDSMRRGGELEQQGHRFSGCRRERRPAGRADRACIMVGGRRRGLFRKYEALFRDLSVENGYAYVGQHGAGHFVKMVHNGIEYGMMQALAEGLYRPEGIALRAGPGAGRRPVRSRERDRVAAGRWLKEAYEQLRAGAARRFPGMRPRAGKECGPWRRPGNWALPVPVIAGVPRFPAAVRSRTRAIRARSFQRCGTSSAGMKWKKKRSEQIPQDSDGIWTNAPRRHGRLTKNTAIVLVAHGLCDWSSAEGGDPYETR